MKAQRKGNGSRTSAANALAPNEKVSGCHRKENLSNVMCGRETCLYTQVHVLLCIYSDFDCCCRSLYSFLFPQVFKKAEMAHSLHIRKPPISFKEGEDKIKYLFNLIFCSVKASCWPVTVSNVLKTPRC
uniref:Uncharacterized protein n=1 Tax=Nothobranchius kuhntae TaxID=321403 RepID=A0A1A8IR95_NOTKU